MRKPELRKWIEFRNWLDENALNVVPRTRGTYVTDAKKVEKVLGDLDEVFKFDELNSIIETLKSEGTEKLFSNKIQYGSLSGYVTAVKQYQNFKRDPDHFDDGDTINDLDAESPIRRLSTVNGFIRNPAVRNAVKLRSNGKCEYCDKLGFDCENGSPYIECHHIIALSDDGEDRLTNVIALCPEHHREAHLGKRKKQLEKEMQDKLFNINARISRRPSK